jgi:hypothetical protein
MSSAGPEGSYFPDRQETEEFIAPGPDPIPENQTLDKEAKPRDGLLPSVAEIIAHTLASHENDKIKRQAEKLQHQPASIIVETELNQENPSNRLVLEQIEAAAEQNIAMEGYYERRHEAKDEPGDFRSTASSRDRQTAQNTPNDPLPVPTQKSKSSERLLTNLGATYAQVLKSPIYRRALIRGCAAGIVVCIMALLLSLN